MNQDRMAVIRDMREYAVETEGWFPALLVALEGVGAKEAAWREHGTNTIWQIVNHLNFYNRRLLQRLNGEAPDEANSNTETFGAPGEPEDTEGWEKAKNQAVRIAEGIKAALEKLADSDLDRPFPNAPLGELVTNMALHDAHHAGQIVLIRKMQQSWPAQREF